MMATKSIFTGQAAVSVTSPRARKSRALQAGIPCEFVTEHPISFRLEIRAKETAMHIDIAPETERVVREELHSGHFQSVDDLILSSVQAWRERNAAATVTGAPEKNLVEFFQASPLVGLELEQELDDRPIWEVITEVMKDVPDEVFDRLPKDGASQVDHYIYGLPKRS